MLIANAILQICRAYGAGENSLLDTKPSELWLCFAFAGKAAEGRTHSKTLRARGVAIIRASVLECASPLALWNGGAEFGWTSGSDRNTVGNMKMDPDMSQR